MKVLVGVDGSANSFAAVRFVGRILSPDRDEIVLIYATPDASYLSDEQLDESVLVRARDSLSRVVYDEAISRLPPAWQAKISPPPPTDEEHPPSAALLE